MNGPRRALLRRITILCFLCIALSLAPACVTGGEGARSGDEPASGPGPLAQVLAEGDRQFRAGAWDRALYFYLQALDIDDANADVCYKIGLVRDARGESGLAEQAYAAALVRDATHAGALVRRGTILLHARRYEAAKAHFERVPADGAHAAAARNGLGVIADLQRDHERAAAHFLAALEADPDDVGALVNLGYSHYLAGNWAGSETMLQRALAVQPGHRRAQQNLGLLRARQGRYAAAIEILSRVMGMAEACNDVGYAAMLDGKHAVAERYFAQAIRLSPTYHASAQANLVRNRRQAAGRADPAPPDPPAAPVPAPAARAGASGDVAAGDGDEGQAGPGTLNLRRFVAADSLRVRRRAGTDAPIMGRLTRGQVVRVLHREDNWAFVKFWRHDAGGTSEQTGWVHARYLVESRYLAPS